MISRKAFLIVTQNDAGIRHQWLLNTNIVEMENEPSYGWRTRLNTTVAIFYRDKNITFVIPLILSVLTQLKTIKNLPSLAKNELFFKLIKRFKDVFEERWPKKNQENGGDIICG